MKYRPLADQVLVRPDPEQDKTRGGIVIPDVARKRLNRGTVVAVGPGPRVHAMRDVRCTMEIAEGDRVVYSAYAGNPLEEGVEGDGKLLVMRESEILCVVTP